MILRNSIVAVTLFAYCSALGADSFDGRYAARVGDVDADGRQDIFVEYRPKLAFVDLDGIAIPVPITKAPTGEFLLKGTASGSFDLISTPTAAQRSAARSLPRAQLPLVRDDYNADGLVDLRVKGTASLIPGSIDPIVFAAPGAGAPATALKSLDPQTMLFIDDLNGWVSDPAYYESGWQIVAITEYDGFSWPTYNCGGTLYPDISVLNPTPTDPVFGDPGGSSGSLPNGGAGCIYVGDVGWNNVIVTTWEFDPSGFHPDAMDVARKLLTYRHGDNAFTLSNADKQALIATFSEVFGGIVFATPGAIPVPGTPPPPAIDWPWLRWTSRVNPLILLAMLINIAIPNSTADDDTLNFFHHYSFLALAPSIAASGLFAPAFLTQGPIMSGQQANINLNLGGATRDAVYFVTLPKSWPLLGPRPIVGGGEGWTEWISNQPIPAFNVSPPRALAP